MTLSCHKKFIEITLRNNIKSSWRFLQLGLLHSFRTDSALKKQERLCGNHDYCR